MQEGTDTGYMERLVSCTERAVEILDGLRHQLQHRGDRSIEGATVELAAHMFAIQLLKRSFLVDEVVEAERLCRRCIGSYDRGQRAVEIP